VPGYRPAHSVATRGLKSNRIVMGAIPSRSC
jgi:hypothetical protein